MSRVWRSRKSIIDLIASHGSCFFWGCDASEKKSPHSSGRIWSWDTSDLESYFDSEGHDLITIESLSSSDVSIGRNTVTVFGGHLDCGGWKLWPRRMNNWSLYAWPELVNLPLNWARELSGVITSIVLPNSFPLQVSWLASSVGTVRIKSQTRSWWVIPKVCMSNWISTSQQLRMRSNLGMRKFCPLWVSLLSEAHLAKYALSITAYFDNVNQQTSWKDIHSPC